MMTKKINLSGLFLLFLIVIFNLRVEAKTVIYRTRGDYSDLVAIRLANEGTVIATIPIIAEVAEKVNELSPTALDKSYWLDQANIDYHSGFINMSYKDYAKLEKMPELSEFFELILDDEPFIEFFECEEDFTVAEINAMINNHQLEYQCQQKVEEPVIEVEKEKRVAPYGWILLAAAGVSLIVWERKKVRKAD